MAESQNPLSESEAKRPGAGLTIRRVVGATVLALVAIVVIGQIFLAVLGRDFVHLTVSLCVIGLVWILTRLVRLIGVRILLRAFAVAVCFWPFIPHESSVKWLEWSLPYPPASYWLVIGLGKGHSMVFETVSILVGTLVMWAAGCMVYQDRQRNDAA